MDIQAVSVLPGRVRLRLPEIKHHPHLARQWEQRLREIAGIEHVVANHLTGSLLIRHCAEGFDWKSLLHLFLPEQEGPPSWESFLAEAAEFVVEETLHPDDAFSKAVHQLVCRLNNAVTASTGVGLRTLTPAAFVLFGMSDLLFSKRRERPPWFTLFWYAMSSFSHFNPPPGGEKPGGEQPAGGKTTDTCLMEGAG